VPREGPGARRVPRARYLVAAGLGVWVVASLVPLAWTLPPALRSGTAVRRLHNQIGTLLGSGWLGEITSSAATEAKGPAAWEWSSGPNSTITIQPTWTAISLELKPITCADRKRQRIVVSSSDTRATQTLILKRGFHWYRIDLDRVHGNELRFSYRCVQAPIAIDNGLRHRQPLGVAIAGLRVQGGG